VWVAVVAAYLVVDELESDPGRFLRSGTMNATTFNACRAARYDLLRVMCFGIEAVEELATPDAGSFVRYVLYPPLRQKGPFCFYKEFERHRCDHNRRRFAYAALEIVDAMVWYVLLDFAHRTYYDPFADVARASLFEKIAHAWTHTTAMWAGPTLIFNLSHALAVVDGQVVIRDVSVHWLQSGTSFGMFWRKFHCSLHEAFVRLLYRPLGSSLLSVVVVMAFSLLFHGLKSKAWFVFFGANTAGVVFERCFQRFQSSDRVAVTLYQTALFMLFTRCTTNIPIDVKYFAANFALFWWMRRADEDEGGEGDD
jgi:D-alanyl-lipoteichoic acid acyltransferase DltB (MBOAT superfamily)